MPWSLSARLRRSSTPMSAALRVEVVAIEARALHAHDADDIAPLTIGCFAAETEPAQLLQQDVLGRMDEEGDRGRNGDGLTALQLLCVQGRSASDEQVHLHTGVVVNQVDG